MSIDKSLRRKNSLQRARNVLTRGERIKQLQDEERWQTGRTPFGLPKVKVLKVKKAKKVKEEEKPAEGEAAAAAAPAPGDRSSLAQVPATAPIVLYLRGAEGTKDRLLVTLKAALPERLPQIQPFLDNLVKEGIDGRKLAGVPKDGPIFLVFTELPKPADNPPKIAVVLAVNKYEEFRDGLLKAHQNTRTRELMFMWRLTAFEAIPDDYQHNLTEIRKVYPGPAGR